MMPPDGAPKPAAAARETFTAALEAALDRLAARRARSRHAGAASSEPRRVRERHPRSAGARRRRQRAAAAGRFGGRLRQHRRRARRLAGADRGLRRGGREDQPARRWRSVHRSRSRGLSRAWRSVAGRAPRGLPLGTRGGIVVRHTFPLDAEYDLQVGAGAAAHGLAGPPAAGPRADDLYVALDGARVALQGRGATRIRMSGRAAHHRRGACRAHADGGRRRHLPRRGAHARHHAGHHRRPASTRPGPATRRAGARC